MGISSSYLGRFRNGQFRFDTRHGNAARYGYYFCIPKPWGDEDQSFLKIVGVNQVPIVWKDVDREYVQQRVSKAGMNADQYYKYRDHIYADFSYRHVTDLGCLEFSGRYPDNLLEEINNYSIVAGVIARTEEYDIIHAHDWLTYPAGIHAKM